MLEIDKKMKTCQAGLVEAQVNRFSSTLELTNKPFDKLRETVGSDCQAEPVEARIKWFNIVVFLIVITVFSACTQKQVVIWPEITKETKPWTRWWWLGSDVDSTGLKYNLEALGNAGIGGVEITPIYGVKGREVHYKEYLSTEWMKMLDFTQSETQRLGMGTDMNSGTGWPFGGPDVSIEDAASKAIFAQFTLKKGELIVEKFDAQGDKNAKLDKVMIYLESGKVIDATHLVAERGLFSYTPPEDGKMVALYVGKTLQQVKRAAPGGQGYVVNHFDKEAVKRYLSKFDKAFAENKTPFPNGFFNDSYEVYGANWTKDLLLEFEKKRGYKLQDYFWDLLANGSTDQSVRVISDYRETVGDILKENFTEVWTEWAHSHGVITRNQAHGSPANLIDIYAAVDIPECESFGISDFDIPGLRKDEIHKKNDGDPAILKYASSAAHISGKKYTSSETFTWLTEHFRTSLSQAKVEIDQMFTSGVNHVYFHGSTYSPENAEWPGWKFYASVDMSPTNSIWKDAPAFFKYVTRVQSFLQEGQPDNDFLLYLPMHDIWANQRGGFFTTFAIHGMRERLPEFCEAVDEIMGHGYDLDYISDQFILNTNTENGQLKTIGGAKYKALIVPAANLIPLETMKKLVELSEKGATIIFTDHFPSDVPGLANLDSRRTEMKGLLEEIKTKAVLGKDYKELLSKYKDEKFVSEFGGQLIRRKHENGYTYFMTMLKNKPVNAWVPLAVNAESAVIFDPLTGKEGQANVRKSGNNTEVYIQLKPGESLILKTYEKKIPIRNKWQYYGSKGQETLLSQDWELSFTDSQPEIKETFKLDNLTSWTNLANPDLKRNMGTGKYSKRFNFEKKSGAEYLLQLGDVRESAKVIINGTEVATLFSVPFETYIGEYLKNGENLIEIEVTNLPANRIRDYDQRGVQWRNFHEINFVSITYKPTKFDQWEIMPSGLLGEVKISEITNLKP